MSYDRMKLTVGTFVLLFLVSTLFFGYLLLDAKGAFEKRLNYYFITDSAEYISIGMPVKFSGFAIGSIDNMKLLDDGHVRVGFSVTKQNSKWINRYTYLLLKKPLIGSPHIEVLAASGNPVLKPGSRLPIIITDDINDMVTKFEPVIDRLLNIIKNVETMSNYLVDGSSPLNKTLGNLERFTTKLATDDSLLTTVVGDANATRSVVASLHEINTILKELSSITRSLDAKIIQPTSDSIHELHSILRDVNKKLTELEPLVQTAGGSSKDIQNLKQSIHLTIEKSNRLMEKLNAILAEKKDPEVHLP